MSPDEHRMCFVFFFQSVFLIRYLSVRLDLISDGVPRISADSKGDTDGSEAATRAPACPAITRPTSKTPPLTDRMSSVMNIIPGWPAPYRCQLERETLFLSTFPFFFLSLHLFRPSIRPLIKWRTGTRRASTAESTTNCTAVCRAPPDATSASTTRPVWHLTTGLSGFLFFPSLPSRWIIVVDDGPVT